MLLQLGGVGLAVCVLIGEQCRSQLLRSAISSMCNVLFYNSKVYYVFHCAAPVLKCGLPLQLKRDKLEVCSLCRAPQHVLLKHVSPACLKTNNAHNNDAK